MTGEPTGNLLARGADVPQEDKQAHFGSYTMSQGQRARGLSNGHCTSGQPGGPMLMSWRKRERRY